MRKKLILVLLVFILILNTQIGFAAKDLDYDIGYKAGFAEGKKYSHISNPVEVQRALRNYKETDAYKKFTGIVVEFEEGFINGYFDGLYIPQEEIEAKTDYADVLGTTLGSIYGARDYQLGRVSNWRRALPSNKTLTDMYNLKKETSKYVYSFISNFRIKFEEAYVAAFEKANLEPVKDTQSDGIADGEELGRLLGSIYGAKDYLEGLTINFNRHIPSDRNIILHYSLNNDYHEYKDGFMSGFKSSFELEYNKTYREANKNNILRDEEDAYENGQELGFKIGEMHATNDFMEKRPNNWKRLQKNSGEITVEYSLTLQSSNYRDGFISGFQDGYSEGYSSKYKSLALEIAMDSTIAEIIPISGGALTTYDGIFTVTIEKGTFYNPVNLTIDTIGNYKSHIGDNYIKGSEVVRVSILNTSKDLDNEKPIELKFEYYGDADKSGIYKYVNGDWVYLNSFVEEGFIKTIIKPRSISSADAVYAVLINKSIPVFHDIRGHWAKDEINTLIRRSIINGYTDKTFKPDNKITRAEFLTLLSRVYNWKLPSNTNNITQFKDSARFGNYDKIISYGISAGYIKGYDDNTFKPHDTISYKEVEIIMGRAVDKNFKWYNTSAKMLYEKKVRASSYDNINYNINRGEVSYMLYILNEGKY